MNRIFTSALAAAGIFIASSSFAIDCYSCRVFDSGRNQFHGCAPFNPSPSDPYGDRSMQKAISRAMSKCHSAGKSCTYTPGNYNCGFYNSCDNSSIFDKECVTN